MGETSEPGVFSRITLLANPGLTKELACDVLVSGTTRKGLGDEFSVAPLPAVRVKGKSGVTVGRRASLTNQHHHVRIFR